jgi:hypothetical protein
MWRVFRLLDTSSPTEVKRDLRHSTLKGFFASNDLFGED